MLVTELLVAEVDVDLALVAQAGALSTIGHELARTIIAMADERAWKVRPESVHVRRLDETARVATERFRGVWSPEEARFVGGEYDGDKITVRREVDGLPLQLLTMPYRSFAGWVDELARPTVTINPSYERAGIDPIDDIWIYKHVS